MSNPIADVLEFVLSSPNVPDRAHQPANLVDTTADMADAINRVASALHRLGTADAATPLGAIEVLSGEVRDGSRAIADAISELAAAIRETRT